MSQNLAIYGGTPVILPGSIRAWPPIDESDDKLVLAALHQENQTRGNYTRQLQSEFGEFNGNQFVYFTCSGTAALHMCIAACGIGAGDQVITTAYTWPSSASCIIHNMAVPVFVDIDPETFLMDPGKIEAAITPRTKAILPVHLHGLCCDMDPIMAIAKKHNLKVIEDACQAHNALYKWKKAGTFGDCAAFSFNQNKCLTSGEGGLFVCNDLATYKRGCQLVEFIDRQSVIDDPAFHDYGMAHKYCNNEVTAGFALAEFHKFDLYYHGLLKNARTLDAKLRQAALPALRLPYEPKNCTHIWYNYTLRVDFDAIGMGGRTIAEKVRFRNAVCEALKAEGVTASSWLRCITPQLPVFRAKNVYGGGYPWAVPGADVGVDYSPEKFPVAMRMLYSHIAIAQCLRYPNTPELASQVGDAIIKVFSQLNEIDPARIEAILQRRQG